MPFIASIPCTFVRGTAPVPKERLDVYQVAGVDGYGAQLLGLGDSPFRFLAVLYGTPAVVEAWAASVQSLQGSVVTIINDWGKVYTGCLLVRVSEHKMTPALYQGGSRGELMIEGVVT